MMQIGAVLQHLGAEGSLAWQAPHSGAGPRAQLLDTAAGKYSPVCCLPLRDAPMAGSISEFLTELLEESWSMFWLKLSPNLDICEEAKRWVYPLCHD